MATAVSMFRIWRMTKMRRTRATTTRYLRRMMASSTTLLMSPASCLAKSCSSMSSRQLRTRPGSFKSSTCKQGNANRKTITPKATLAGRVLTKALMDGLPSDRSLRSNRRKRQGFSTHSHSQATICRRTLRSPDSPRKTTCSGCPPNSSRGPRSRGPQRAATDPRTPGRRTSLSNRTLFP